MILYYKTNLDFDVSAILPFCVEKNKKNESVHQIDPDLLGKDNIKLIYDICPNLVGTWISSTPPKVKWGLHTDGAKGNINNASLNIIIKSSPQWLLEYRRADTEGEIFSRYVPDDNQYRTMIKYSFDECPMILGNMNHNKAFLMRTDIPHTVYNNSKTEYRHCLMIRYHGTFDDLKHSLISLGY